MEKEKQYIFRRYPNISLFVFLMGLLLLFFVVAESYLTYVGFEPGFYCRGWAVKKNDSLVLNNDYYTNSEGVFVARNDYFTRFNEHDYPYCINSQGFRTIAFDTSIDSTIIKLMFIGDSFTWGGGAEPLNKCFVDIIDTCRLYQTYNLGIPGADPAQYHYLAQKYIPVIKPDVVICPFFLANDIMWHKRPITKNLKLFYWTNQGAVIGYRPTKVANTDSINPFTPFRNHEEAYQYAINRCALWEYDNNWMKYLCSKTRTTTIAWFLIKRIIKPLPSTPTKTPIVNEYLQEMERVAAENDALFLLLLIPDINQASLSLPQIKAMYNEGVFENRNNIYLPPNLHSDYYLPLPNGHLNNEGNAVYAQYLYKLLDTLTIKK